MLKRNKKGQSLLEYVFVILIVLGAFVATGNYLKRGLQGRWKDAVDGMGDQYDPRVANTSLNYAIQQNAETIIRTINAVNGIWTTRTDSTNAVETKTGYTSAGAY